MIDDPAALVAVELSERERDVLCAGLGQWGGPVDCAPALALAMDFDSVEDLLARSRRLRASLRAAEPLSARDWRRAVVATEIAFVSVVLGAGWDWRYTTGFEDEETIGIIRSVQRKVSGALNT